MNFNRETILSIALGFVAVWFGVNEILHPTSWAAFVPAFARSFAPAVSLVIIHGIVLCLSGLSIVFGWKRRVFAAILAVMIAQIIFTLISASGLDETAVRDIGLLGVAIALAWRN